MESKVLNAKLNNLNSRLKYLTNSMEGLFELNQKQ